MNLEFLVTLFGALTLLPSHASAQTNDTTVHSKYPVYNFTQQVDHFNNNGTNFQQRYQIVDDYFKAGGPILFVQSAETSLVAIETNVFMDWAEELGALVVTLEHRYFGGSYPDNFEPTKEGYAPLTLDNVLEDAKVFIEWTKKTVPSASQSKAIVTGGSYGGFLAIELRLRYPDVFFGSFSSSPITESWGPLASNPYRFEASKWVSNVYYDESALAAEKVKTSMREFYTCAFIGRNCTEALPDMNLCGPLPTADEYASIIYASALTQYFLIPQLNYGIAIDYAVANPFQYLIHSTLAAHSPGAVVRAPLAMANWQDPSSDECLDWSSTNITHRIPTALGSSWPYINCVYMIASETAVSDGNMLPPTQDQPDSRLDSCEKPSWESPFYNQTNEYFTTKYGLSDENIDNTTRLLIVHGSYDRTAAIGSPKLTSSNDRMHSRVILVQDIAHTEDSFSTLVVPRGVRPQLDSIRDTKLEYTKEWLGLYNSSNVWAC